MKSSIADAPPEIQGLNDVAMTAPPRRMKLAVLGNTGPFVWLDLRTRSEGDMDFSLYAH
jgi:hypothetical protein